MYLFDVLSQGPNAPGVPDNDNAPFGTSAWLKEHMEYVITGVVVVLFLFIVCVVIMMALMVRIYRRIDSTKSPCSSHNTSRSSLTADV